MHTSVLKWMQLQFLVCSDASGSHVSAPLMQEGKSCGMLILLRSPPHVPQSFNDVQGVILVFNAASKVAKAMH